MSYQNKFITISSDEFSWVESLQSAVTDISLDRVWLLGDSTTGVQGLCNALRHEEGAHKIRLLIVFHFNSSVISLTLYFENAPSIVMLADVFSIAKCCKDSEYENNDFQFN